jgi:fermentation-respiration switch protein FrsA (DUF1100 family)
MKSLIIVVLLLVIELSGCAPLVNKLAFFPDTADTLSVKDLPRNVQEVYINEGSKVRIQCYLLPCPGAKNIVLYFPGNAGNIGYRLPELAKLRADSIAVMGVGYRGYGKSTGRPSEKGIYKDAEAAFRYACDSLGFSQEHIFIMGRSIGTTAAINVAMNKHIAGLILVTALTNGRAYASAHGLALISFLAGAAFDNLGKVKRLTCPVLVIHGTIDGTIPYSMGRKVFEAIHSQQKKFVTIEGGDHNDLDDKDPKKYWGEIREFLRGNTK